MLEATITNTFPSGLKLVRHYDSHEVGSYSIDTQCGTVSYYSAMVDQLIYQSLEYYNKPDGKNKFLEKVELHVYSFFIPNMPNSTAQAYCIDLGNYRSRIDIRFYDTPSFGSYKMLAAVSHEMGHAYHNWIRCFSHANINGEFSQFWEKQVSSNHTVWNPNMKPWDQPWGTGSRDEDKFEQFANAFRYFKGVLATRGVSGAGTTDPVVPGFEDPAAHAEWGKQLKILPETCAFWETYGLKPASLVWYGGTTGYWQFQQSDGTWIAQTDYNTWFKWQNNAWVQYWPTYNRT
jgi:hypothetical protein